MRMDTRQHVYLDGYACVSIFISPLLGSSSIFFILSIHLFSFCLPMEHFSARVAFCVSDSRLDESWSEGICYL